MDRLLPSEIIEKILSYMTMTDLVRMERTCRLFQSFSLYEIEKRVMTSNTCKDEWGMLVHVDQVSASPIHFDPKTKTACYSVQMDPVTIKTMFDHKRSIHCSLLRKKLNKYQSFDENGLVITLEKGMTEGKPIQVNIKNKSCQVHAALTRLPYLQNEFVQPVKSIAPTPLTYTLQITQLSLPLSTLAA